MKPVAKDIWTTSRLLIKAAIAGAFLLLLQIPVYYVQHLVEAKKNGQKATVAGVSPSGANRQMRGGPVLLVPFLLTVSDTTTQAAAKLFTPAKI